MWPEIGHIVAIPFPAIWVSIGPISVSNQCIPAGAASPVTHDQMKPDDVPVKRDLPCKVPLHSDTQTQTLLMCWQKMTSSGVMYVYTLMLLFINVTKRFIWSKGIIVMIFFNLSLCFLFLIRCEHYGSFHKCHVSIKQWKVWNIPYNPCFHCAIQAATVYDFFAGKI